MSRSLTLLSSAPLPTVPNSFTTDLEIAFQREDQQRILYGKEMYDGVVKRGVLDYRLSVYFFLIFFLSCTGQLLPVIVDAEYQCKSWVTIR